jgi:two-component system, OmpR family, response regulator RegX3
VTLKEAGQEWNMTTLQIDYYYAEDRIPGAVKMVKTWFFLKTWKSWLTGENEVIHMSQILLLEDDVSLVDGLRYSLKRNGFDITIARTIEEAIKCLQQIGSYDLLLLDVTLPDGTGFDVCNKVRKQGNQIPIIFLTASDEEVNIIRGLDSGGDDYITKPFKLGELCSRIRALLRRAGTASTSSMIECGDISIDLYGSRVLLKGQPLDLTSAEYRLLCLLVRNANRTVTRDNIMNELWDNTSDFVDDNTLSVYVRRLREKIETIPSQPEHLITVRGFGYQWKEVSL